MKPFRGDSKLSDHYQEDQEAQRCPPWMSSKWDKGDLNLDVYFAFHDTCMLHFWNPWVIRKPFNYDSKLPDHYQEHQEAPRMSSK